MLDDRCRAVLRLVAWPVRACCSSLCSLRALSQHDDVLAKLLHALLQHVDLVRLLFERVRPMATILVCDCSSCPMSRFFPTMLAFNERCSASRWSVLCCVCSDCRIWLTDATAARRRLCVRRTLSDMPKVTLTFPRKLLVVLLKRRSMSL